MNNYIVDKLEDASTLSERISDEVDTAKRALAGLLTDEVRGDLYYDISVLLTVLGNIEDAADLIKCETKNAKSYLEKEDHNTTK